MNYAIITINQNETFLKKGHVMVARKGWTNSANNEKIRAQYERNGYTVVIAQFESAAAAKAYADSIKALIN